MTTMQTSHTLDVPGARLHYELRGSGPLIAMIGLPMTSDGFTALAEELATGYTVLTYDPRGFGVSTIDDRDEDAAPALIADDVHRLLAAVTDEPAIVFGSSGGAAIALLLAETHPEQVRTVVAHEPPFGELLPDAAALRAATRDTYDTYLREGAGAAFVKFMAMAGFELPAPDPNAPTPPPPSAQEQADGERMLAHAILPMSQYQPDLAVLRDGAPRIVVAAGTDSTGQMPRRAAEALAQALGSALAEFPGDHVGFYPPMGGDVPAFADVLRTVLT